MDEIEVLALTSMIFRSLEETPDPSKFSEEQQKNMQKFLNRVQEDVLPYLRSDKAPSVRRILWRVLGRSFCFACNEFIGAGKRGKTMENNKQYLFAMETLKDTMVALALLNDFDIEKMRL